jgi:endonuclease-3 related protein
VSGNRNPKRQLLLRIYQSLWTTFGPQGWWPGETPFEIIVGAILTQNTAWSNVEKTLARLKAAKVLSPSALHRMPVRELAPLLRSAGYFNIKAERLKNFVRFLQEEYQGRIDLMFREEVSRLREKLLSIRGIGPETADSILLYAGGYPIFVADAYARRVFSRHGMLDPESDYEEIQNLFMGHLPAEAGFYNEFHALIVRVGKEFCKKSGGKCEACPLHSFLPSFALTA